MAKKHASEEGGGEWPAETATNGEQSEQVPGEPVKQIPPPYASDRPKVIMVPTERGMTEVSTEPTDLGDYEGKYKFLTTGEEFGLKVVEDDPNRKTHHLKSADHYWEGTAEDFRKNFEKQ